MNLCRGAVLLAVWCLVTVLGGVLLAAPSGAVGRDDSYGSATRALDDLGVPGWAVAVIDDGTVVHEEVSGETATGDPARRQTPFALGSVPKTFTATMVMQRVAAGEIGLDDPVRDHLPDFELAGGAGHEITVRQLLSHTSGISERAGLERADRPDTHEDLVPGALSLADSSPIADPGEVHEYSSANYLVLGAMLEEIEGRPFPELLTDDVLGPLGMDRTIVTPEAAERWDLHAGHRFLFGRAMPSDRAFSGSGVPYGSLGSTLGDLETYVRAQLDPPEELLDPETAEQMRAEQVETGPDAAYGLGWSLRERDDLPGRLVMHTGAAPGSFAHVLLLPEEDIAVVVLANAYGQAEAPVLAGVGEDLMRSRLGLPVDPGVSDPALEAAPWVGVALVVLGILALAVQTRSLVRGAPVRRGRALSTLVVAMAVSLLAVALPLLVGLGWRELHLWVPGVAMTVVASGVVWALVAGMILARLVRHRRVRPTRKPTGMSVSRSVIRSS